MIRSSRHILKFANAGKLEVINQIFVDYKLALECCIDLIVSKQLPLKMLLSSKEIPTLGVITHSAWKAIIYKQASEILRSQVPRLKDIRFKRYQKVYVYFKDRGRQVDFTSKRYKELNIKIKLKKPIIDEVTIPLDERIVDVDQGKSFDEFIRVKTPYFNNDSTCKRKPTTKINLPIKYHKQSLKFTDWTRKKTIQLKKINGNPYLIFIYEKEMPIKTEGTSLGVDIGYKKLLATSDGEVLGQELESLYEKVARKQRTTKKGLPSKAYNRAIIHKRDKINEVCNRLNLYGVKMLVAEDLKGLKYKSKLSTRFLNRMQYWSYKQVLTKLELMCQEHGVQMVKVSPAYTSQTCSKCGNVDRDSRKGERFMCTTCAFELDADINAAINIHNRGAYAPSDEEKVTYDNNLEVIHPWH